MTNSVTTHFELEKQTKNKVRYKGPDEFGILYVPKAWFEGNVPQKLDIEATW